MILCARSTSRSSEQSKKRRSRSETRERFVHSIVKRTRLYGYQSFRNFVGNSQGAQRFVGSFCWLCFLDADWLGRKTLMTWIVQQVAHQICVTFGFCASTGRKLLANFQSDNEELVIFSKRKYHTPKSRVWFALSTDNKTPRYFIFDLDFGNDVSLFDTMGGWSSAAPPPPPPFFFPT